MDLQLAKLFAELGFKYDKTKLNEFKKDLKDLSRMAKSGVGQISVDISKIGSSAATSSSYVDSFVKKIRSSYSKVRPSLESMKKDLGKINRQLDSNNLSSAQKEVYQDLHDRVLKGIQKEEQRRLAAVERVASAQKREQQAEAKQEKALSREKERQANKRAKERQAEVRERLKGVLERRRFEEKAERERHQQAIRNIRYEGRLAHKEAKRYRKGLFAVGGTLGALGGIYSLGESTKQYQSYQGSLSGLAAATGSKEKAEVDFKWLRELSDKLGVFAGSITKNYTSLAANTKSAGIDDKTTKDVFESVLSYSRVLNLSKDDTSGVLRALSQMVGKGKLSAEEVRQQAGERLPGFIPAAAKAMGFGEGQEGISKFFKELEAGHLKAKDLLPNLSKELMTMANSGGALSKAVNTTSAAIGRLQTNFWMANKKFNEAGFDLTVRNLANTLSDSAKKMDLVWAALGKASNVVGTALETPIEIIGTLSESIQSLFANNPQIKGQAKAFAAAVTLAFAPLRKIFAMLWVVPAGISALNDLLQSWKNGDLGKKSWKELGLEIGLATGSLIILGRTLYKILESLKAVSAAARGLKGSLTGVKLASEALNESDSYDGSGGKSSKGKTTKRKGKVKSKPRLRFAGKMAGVGIGAAALAGAALDSSDDSDETEEEDSSQKKPRKRRELNSASTYATNAAQSGANGALYGSFFGTPGAVVGGALGAGYGAGKVLDQDITTNLNNQLDFLVTMGSKVKELYSSVKDSYSNAEDPFKELQNRYGKLTSNIFSFGISDHLIDDTQNFLQSKHMQAMNPKGARDMQPSTTIGTQNNGPKIDKIEFNIQGGNTEEVRSTLEKVLLGHIRSASSSTPMTEY